MKPKHSWLEGFIPKLSKGFSLGAVFGGLIGLIISIAFLLTGNDSVILLTIPIITALLAGLAGLIGVIIKELFYLCGLTNNIYLNLITFIILIILLVAISSIFIPWSQKQYLIIAVLVCLLGAGVNFYNYRLEKMRQRLTTLELENKLLGELASKDRKLQELTNNLAVVEERNRMARELHDSISQGIHGIVFAVNSLKENNKTSNKDRVLQIIDHLERTAEATLDELRAMIMELKPSNNGERDLLQAIRIHSELFAKRQQIELDLDLHKATGLTPGQEMMIYRVIQEALANIQRHAEANQVKISCERLDPNELRFIIIDNGKGFDPKQVQKGNGLTNMAERCRENGAEFNLISKPGAGTKIEIILNVLE